jgi:ABC-type branched-subunit amino acid transport system ATPase component
MAAGCLLVFVPLVPIVFAEVRPPTTNRRCRNDGRWLSGIFRALRVAGPLIVAGVVLMPQGDALFPGLSVKDNLDSGAFAAGWRERKQRRERVLRLFPRLADRLGQSAGTLSGGERRMCSLGRGLMADARVYLIDEPSLGLAPGIAAGLFSTLRELDAEGGALILAEQNQALLEGWIDRIVRIHGGEIVGIAPGDAPSDGGSAEGEGRETDT